MSTLFARIVACASAAALAFGAGAGAAQADVPLADQWKIVPLAELVRVGQDICDAHPGDPDTQISLATAAPYNFVEVGEEDDGTVMYWNGTLMFRVIDGKVGRGCMVRGRVGDEVGLSEARKLGEPLFGSNPLAGDDFLLWQDLAGGKPVNHIMTFMVEEDANLAGFGLVVQ